MDPTNLVIAGVPLATLVIGLVQLTRQLGLPPKLGGLVAVAVGIALAEGAQFTTTPAPFANWFNALVLGITVGLVASGLYSTIKNVSEHGALEHGARPVDPPLTSNAGLPSNPSRADLPTESPVVTPSP